MDEKEMHVPTRENQCYLGSFRSLDFTITMYMYNEGLNNTLHYDIVLYR
jgi:hypothetical protein